MTIDELIHELELIKNLASGDTEVLVEHNHQGVCYDLQKPVCEWDLISKKRIVYLQLDEDWIDEEIVRMKEYKPSDMKRETYGVWEQQTPLETISAERMMKMKDLKVLHLLMLNEDVDVYDDVCEELGIAFCNPFDDDKVHMWSEYLTEEGMEKFREVLFYPAHIVKQIINGDEFYNFIVEIDDEDDKVWKKRLRKEKEFFESAAGYCSCEDYDNWFKM